MKSLVFADVETTGLKSYADQIIEIYLFKVDSEGDISDYHTMINPKRPLPAIITNITGITDYDLKDAPEESQVAETIRQFIGDGVLVAHNLKFDQRFLDAMFTRQKLPPMLTGGIDTLEISRALFPKLCIYPKGEGSHKLKNLMYHFGLDKKFANSHRAQDDVLLLVQVYRELELYANGVNSKRYPQAVTHGCPRCGQAMSLYLRNQQSELVCEKAKNSCGHRLTL